MVGNAREWLNKNSAIVTIAAVVLLIVSLGIIIMTIKPRSYRPRIVDVYYYDLGSGKTFLAKSNDVPPIMAPSQSPSDQMPLGVRAYLYACGECPKDLANMTPEQLAQQRVFIGWFEMYDPQTKEQMEAMQRGEFRMEESEGMEPPPEAFDYLEQGHLVALPARSVSEMQWVSMASEEGFTIMQQLQEVCPPETTPKPCFPGR